MQFSRRSLLLGSFAAALFPSSPARSAVFIFEIAKDIGELLEAVDGVAAIVRWTKGASKLLDNLLKKSPDVTDELKRLNIALKNSSFPEFVENKLKADLEQYKINLSELQSYQNESDVTRFRIALLTDHLESDVLLSLEYGPAAYPTTYTAAIVVRALYKYTGMERDHQRQFFTTVANQFADWLDPSKKGNPSAARCNEVAEVKRNQKQVTDIKDKYKGDYEITGDLDNGFKINRLSKLPDAIIGDPDPDSKAVTTEYLGHKKIIADLDEHVSRLQQYHQSLVDVAEGGLLTGRQEEREEDRQEERRRPRRRYRRGATRLLDG